MPVSARWVAAIKDWLRPRSPPAPPLMPGRLARQYQPGDPARAATGSARIWLLHTPPRRHRVVIRTIAACFPGTRSTARIARSGLTSSRSAVSFASRRTTSLLTARLPLGTTFSSVWDREGTSRPRSMPRGCRCLNSIGRKVRMVWCAVFPGLRRVLLGTPVWLDLAGRRDGQERIAGPFAC
jgi:hypothetical protein